MGAYSRSNVSLLQMAGFIWRFISKFTAAITGAVQPSLDKHIAAMSLSLASSSNFSLIGALFAFFTGALGHNTLLTFREAFILMLGTGIWLFIVCTQTLF